jgi:hypothetical protein
MNPQTREENFRKLIPFLYFVLIVCREGSGAVPAEDQAIVLQNVVAQMSHDVRQMAFMAATARTVRAKGRSPAGAHGSGHSAGVGTKRWH